VIVARRCDTLADITTAVTIFRWRDDAARQAANSCIQEVAERMGQAVPGLTAVSVEDYELATEL
jgi:hypothetical protein